MTAKRVTFPDKNENAPRGSVERRIWDADINQIKEVINDHADKLNLGGGGYRVFESMPSLEDLADGEVAFVVSGGVVPDPDPDPELVNIVTQLATGATFSGSGLSSSNVPDGASGNWDNAWNEIIAPATMYENATTITIFNFSEVRFVKVDLKAQYTADILRMWGGNFDNCINDFKLQGSNNDIAWTDLLTGNLLKNGQYQDFEITSPGSYRYYRINVLSNHTTGSNTRATLWDIRLLGDAI